MRRDCFATSGGRARVALLPCSHLVLPALLAIPTAIEPRFLLPLWILIYGFVVFRVAVGDALRALVRPWKVVPVVALEIHACCAHASETYSQILGAPPSFEIWCVRC